MPICLCGGQRLAEEQQDKNPLRSNFSSELGTWNPQEKTQISSRSSEKDCMCGHLDRGLGYSESFLPQLWAPLRGLLLSWESLVFKAILSFQSPKGTSGSVLVKEESLTRERLAERVVYTTQIRCNTQISPITQLRCSCFGFQGVLTSHLWVHLLPEIFLTR